MYEITNWELNLYRFLSKLTNSKRYAKFLADKFNKEPYVPQLNGSRKPSFMPVDSFYFIYPKIDYITLLDNVEDVQWRSYIIASLFADFDDALQGETTFSKPQLTKIIQRIVDERLDSVVEALLWGKGHGAEAAILNFIICFSLPPQLYVLLEHPAAKEKRNHHAVEHIVNYLHQWDANYPYKEYPQEWLEEVYNQKVVLTNPYEPDRWIEAKTDSFHHA